jgi:hypothetical protein
MPIVNVRTRASDLPLCPAIFGLPIAPLFLVDQNEKTRIFQTKAQDIDRLLEVDRRPQNAQPMRALGNLGKGFAEALAGLDYDPRYGVAAAVGDTQHIDVDLAYESKRPVGSSILSMVIGVTACSGS